MQVVERTHSGNSLINLESWLLSETRCIFIEGNINMESAEQFKRQMMYLTAKSDDPIEIHINSIGGEVDAGMNIYDIINGSSAPIYIICTGYAYSMAAVIFACAHATRRFILPNSETMLHEVLAGGISGTRSTVKAISRRMDQKSEKINELLAKHMGRSLEDVRRMTTNDHFFSAEESVESGLCDAVVDLNQFHKLIAEHK